MAKWEKRYRYYYIIFRLNKYKKLNRKDLVDFFGISLAQASKDINDFIEESLWSIRYDKKEKVYVWAIMGFDYIRIPKEEKAFLDYVKSY